MKLRKITTICICISLFFILSGCSQGEIKKEANVKFEEFRTSDNKISWNSTRQDIRDTHTAGTIEEKGTKLSYENDLGDIKMDSVFEFSEDDQLKRITEALSFDSEKMALLMYRGTIDSLKEKYGEPVIKTLSDQMEMVFWSTQIEDTGIIITYNYSPYTKKYFYIIEYNNKRLS